MFFFLSVAASGVPLSVVTVKAETIKCKFDADCQPLVADRARGFALPGSDGVASLLARTWPVGKEGTPVAGLHAYLYLLDLSGLAGSAGRPCIAQLRFDFGPVAPLDYDGDGRPDQVFVIASGGPGTVGPSAARQSGDRITFDFSRPVCVGEESFFFGLASTQPPRDVVAEIASTSDGGVFSLDTRAPELAGGGAAFRLLLPKQLVPGRSAALRATGARPGATIELYAGQRSGSTPVQGCAGLDVEIGRPSLASSAVAGPDGKADLEVSVPIRLLGDALYLQAVEHPACRVSRLVSAKSGS